MKKIFIYARPWVYKMTSAFFFHWLQSFCPVLPYYLKYGTNQRRTAQFFIGIDFFDPDPTKSKNKPPKNCTFRTFLGRPAAANVGRQTFNGNNKITNWSLTAFLYLLLFLNFFNLGNEVYSYQLRIYQTIKVTKNLSAANIFATKRQITVTLCLNIKCYNLFPLRI